MKSLMESNHRLEIPSIKNLQKKLVLNLPGVGPENLMGKNLIQLLLMKLECFMMFNHQK